jgi:hypothetical protein
MYDDCQVFHYQDLMDQINVLIHLILDNNVEQQHYQNLDIIHEIKDDLLHHQLIENQLQLNELMKDALTIMRRLVI